MCRASAGLAPANHTISGILLSIIRRVVYNSLQRGSGKLQSLKLPLKTKKASSQLQLGGRLGAFFVLSILVLESQPFRRVTAKGKSVQCQFIRRLEGVPQ